MTDTPSAINTIGAFLSQFPGRQCLFTVHPETKTTDQAVFESHSDPALTAWVSERNGKTNVYFTVNELKPDARPTSKPAKTDIGRIRAFHVDLDPDKSKPLDKERARLKLIAAKAAGTGAAVEDTGGGYAAFWPVAPDAPPVDHADAERINRALAHKLGGDPSIWNVDRLMRLPGTINLPDARKRAAGRLPAPAKALRAAARTFTPDEFAHLPDAPRSAKEDNAPAIAAAAQAIGAADWREGEWLELRPELRERLEAALIADPALRATWEGRKAEVAPGDTSRSGHWMTLADHARATGLSPGEFAALVQCAPARDDGFTIRFDWSSETEEWAVRQLARAWGRSSIPERDPARWFQPVAAQPKGFWDEAPAEEASQRPPLEWHDSTATPDDYRPPPRQWVVENWIPLAEVCLLYGSGGVGKTTLAHQLGLSIGLGVPWLAQPVARGSVIALFGEDSKDELDRRHAEIMAGIGKRNAELRHRFHFTSRRAEDNRLALLGKDGSLTLTELWHEIAEKALSLEDRRAIVLDTLADIYPGNEIDRQQVNAFVKQCLTKMAMLTGCAVVVLGHPSQSGEKSGEGTSGSTHWSNAVRSRLYMSWPEKAASPNLRVLSNMKLNYGPAGSKLHIERMAGWFRAVAGSSPGKSQDAGRHFSPIAGEGEDAAGEAVGGAAPQVACTPLPSLSDRLERAIVAAVADIGPRAMSMAVRGNYAPRVLKAGARDLLGAFSVEEVAAAMEALLRRGVLHAVPVGRDHARRPVMGIAVARRGEDDVFE